MGEDAAAGRSVSVQDETVADTCACQFVKTIK
jgi:hypothetical protein